MSSGNLRNLGTKRVLIFAIGAALLAALGAVIVRQMLSSAPIRPVQAKLPEIVARGRIEPLGRVLAINGPAEGTVAIVRKLLVDQGSKVKAGQVLAELEGFEVRRAELAVAQSRLELAELQRAQVQAGAKQAEIAAQNDVIAAKRAQLDRLDKQWNRQSKLHLAGVISTDTLDVLQAERDQAQSEVEQAGNVLKSLSQVRSIDDEVAVARVAVEKATVAQAETEMNRLLVRAPGPGTVLSIQSRAGEAILADGLLRMADLSHLIVVAEIDESNVGLVTEGMKAQIDGEVVSKPIEASVSRLGYEVFRQKRPESDVLVGRDARIVEVELTPETPLPVVVGGEVMVHLLPEQADRR